VATRVKEEELDEKWSQKYKSSINCSHPKGFSQKAHCAGKRKHNEDIEQEMTCPDCGMCETHGDHSRDTIDEACWKGYHKEGNKELFGKTVPNCVKNEAVAESHESCPECGGAMYPDTMINEKQDACYYKVKSRYKVWPSAYASGALVQCRKKGAANWGNKNESQENNMDELSRILELSTGLSSEARAELAEEFDLIESIIDDLAEHNGVDAEAIWEDLESLDDDELYVFATTTTIMETEAWQKANNRDRTDGMSKKAVKTYRREHPGSKLQTAVTTKPSKLKKGSKASKRRKSYCSRSRGQMKMHSISCAKTPDKAICKARRRWNCE
jgi:rubredoxin